MTALTGVAAAVSVGAALAISLGWVELSSMRAPARPERVAADVPSEAPRARGYALEQPSPVPATQPLPGAPSEPPVEPFAQPGAAPPAPAAIDPRAAAEEQRRRAEQAESERKRSEQIKADMEARALKRARGNVAIVMYSAKWCGVCTRARNYMVENGISFAEHDIDEDDSARAAYERLNPRHSVPTIDVEGEVLVGFSGKSLEGLIDKAARKRVR